MKSKKYSAEGAVADKCGTDKGADPSASVPGIGKPKIPSALLGATLLEVVALIRAKSSSRLLGAAKLY